MPYTKTDKFDPDTHETYSFFLVDTVAELPTTGCSLGDLAQTLDTKEIWVVKADKDTNITWVKYYVPGFPDGILSGDATKYMRADGTYQSFSHTQRRNNTATGANSGWTTAFDTSSSSPVADASTGTGSTVATNQAATAVNQNTGGGTAHNNLQPYIVVYMHKRTA